MRTTLQLDEDVYAAARSLARSEGKSLGHIVSALARQGLTPRARAGRTTRGGFPVFSVPRNAAPITAEMVGRALEDG